MEEHTRADTYQFLAHIFCTVVSAVSLLLMIGSLALSIREIQVSVHALNLQLSDLEERDLTHAR